MGQSPSLDSLKSLLIIASSASSILVQAHSRYEVDAYSLDERMHGFSDWSLTYNLQG